MGQCGYENLHVDPFWNFFSYSLKHIRHVSSVTFPVLLSPQTSLKSNRRQLFFLEILKGEIGFFMMMVVFKAEIL